MSDWFKACRRWRMGHTRYNTLRLAVSSAASCFAPFFLLSVLLAQNIPKPELVVQGGHTFQIFSVAYSPDARTIVSGSEDGTAKIWDAASLTELRSIDVLRSFQRSGVHAVAFSPDGKTIATGTVEGSITLWDVATGAEIKSLAEYARSLAFSPDGKTIASASSGQVFIWNVSNGAKMHELPHSGTIKSVCFSSDGKLLLSAGQSGLINIWNAETGARVRTLTGQADEEVQSVAISADARRIASAGMMGDLILWDAATGTKVNTIPGTAIEAVAFSPDSRTLAAADHDGSIKLLDANAGGVVRTIEHKAPIWSIAFSPDGTRLVAGDHSALLTQWDVKSGREINRASRRAEAIHRTVVSPDGRRIALGGWTNPAIKIWGADGGIVSLSRQEHPAEHISFSPDGRMLAGDDGERVNIWDADRSIILKSFAVKCTAFAFAPDGKWLAVAEEDGPHVIKIFGLDTGKILRSWPTNGYWVRAIAYSSDGKHIATGDDEGHVKLWNSNGGKELFQVDGIAASGRVLGLAFSSDGDTFAADYGSGWVGIWNSSSGAKIEEFKRDEAGVMAKVLPRFPTLFPKIAPNGRFAAGEQYVGRVDLVDIHTEQVFASLVSLDDDWLVTTPDGYFDGTPNAWKQMIWRFNNNTFDHGAVELYFNDYFYPNLLQDVLAGKMPATKAGNELEKKDRRQPKIEIVSLNGKTRERAAEKNAMQTISERTTPVEIDVTDNAGEKKQDQWDASSGADDLRLFRNGSLVKVWHGDLFDKASGCEQSPPRPNEPRIARCTTTVTLAAGDNELNAYAFNSSNVRSTDDTMTVKAADTVKRPATLYVLAVGVNEYADKSYNLRYAVADVDEVANAIRQQQEKMAADAKFRHYERTDVVTLTDADATRDNILLALKRFSDGDKAVIPAALSDKVRTELSKIKAASPEDAIIIYYAGHGAARNDRFYLLPHDYNHDPDQTGVSDIDLNQYLERVDAGKLLMVIDACQSGAALGAKDEGRAPMNSKGLAQLAYDKGMLILTAAQSQQAALEAVRINGEETRHGLLTYALLRAFTDRGSDHDGDGRLADREWLDYAAKQVPKLQLAAMKERSDANQNVPPAKRGAELVFVNGDNNADPTRRRVQTPRIFYRREADPSPLVVGRP